MTWRSTLLGLSLGSTALPPRSCVQYRRNSEHRPAPSAAGGRLVRPDLPTLCVRALSAAGGDLLGVRPRPVVLRPGVLAAEPPRKLARVRSALPGEPAGSAPARESAGAAYRRRLAAAPAAEAESDASGYPRVVAELQHCTPRRGRRNRECGVRRPRASGGAARMSCSCDVCGAACAALRPMGISAPATSCAGADPARRRG